MHVVVEASNELEEDGHAHDAEGSWPIVYALHGTGGTGDGLAATASALASHGYVVFSPTWRSEMDAGLDDAAYAAGGTYDDCFAGGPRPSVLVPSAGCYYEYQGNEFAFEPVPFSGRDVDITLVVGNEDTECEPWQSQDATQDLINVGHDAAGRGSTFWELGMLMIDLGRLEDAVAEFTDTPVAATTVVDRTFDTHFFSMITEKRDDFEELLRRGRDTVWEELPLVHQ